MGFTNITPKKNSSNDSATNRNSSGELRKSSGMESLATLAAAERAEKKKKKKKEESKGQALNISIPRGYFEAREAEKQAAAKKNQSSSARWTSRELEALAQSNTKRAEQLAETAYASNDDSRLDELKKAREQAAKFSTAADKKKAEEKAESYAKKATEYAGYVKNHDFETKAAEGAKKDNNIVQYVQNNWLNIARGSPAKKGTKLIYRHLTDDEVKTYNYILAVKGEKEAQEYLDVMEDTLNQREGQSQFEHLKTLGDADYEIKTPQYGNNHKYLTDKEARTYEYIASTVGQEQADKYLKDKEPELQQRKMRGEVFTPQIDKFSEKLATGVHGIVAGGDQWSQGVKQTFSNDLLSPTGTQYAQGQVLEQLQKQSLGSQYVTDEELAQKPNFGGMGYQAAVTVGNMLPMILASQFLGGGAGLAGWADDIAKIAQSKKTIEKFTKMAGAFGKAGKVAGSGVMYMGANGNAYNQARKEGYTEGQARLYGLLVGASEAALQGLLGGITPLKFGPDEIEKRILSLDRVWKRALGLLGYNVLSETAEEEIQLFLEPAFATMMTSKDYESPTFQEAIATALITFLSTGALELIPSIMRANSPEARLISAEAAIQAALKKYEAAKKAVDASDTDANSTVSPAASEEAKQADVSSEAVAASNPDRTVIDAATSLIMEKQGLDLKTATKRAEIIQKLIDGVDMEQKDFIKMVNRLDPKNPKTQAIFTELTGVVFPENRGSVEAMYNAYRSAHEVAQQRIEENRIVEETASLNVEAPVDEAAIPAEAQALHPGVPAIEDVQPGVTEFINEVNNNVGEEGQALRGFASFKEEMSKRDPNLVRGSDEMWERLYRQYLGDNETLEFRGQRFTHREFMSLDLRDEKGKVLSAEEKEARWAAEREFQQEKARKRERGLQLRLTEQQRYATVKWEKALKSYGIEVIWDDTMGRAPGSSDQRGAIYLNPRRLTTETAIAEIVAHELVHSIENAKERAAMVEDIIETLHPKNKSLDEELDKEIKKYQRYYDENGIDFTVTPEWIREEYAGDLMRATFTDETLRAKLAGEKPSIMRKILNAIDKFLDFVEDTNHRKEVAAIRDRFAKALATNADDTYRKPGDIYNEDGKLVVSSNDQGYSRLSLSTYEMEGREYLVNWMDTAVDKGDLTREDADAIIDSLDQIYDTCMEYKEKYGPFSEWSDAKVVTDANGNPVFSVVKPNGDYAMNLDFSLVCKKRRTLDAVLNELVKRGVADDLRMGQKDFVKINNIIRTYGFETACDLCFVDAKRFRQAEVADNFVKMYNDLVKSLAPKGSGITFDYFNFGGNTLVQNTGTGIDTLSDADLDFTTIDNIIETQKPESGAGSVEYRIAKHLKATAADRKLVMRGDFISTAGFDTVNVTNPAVLKLFNAKKGSAGPKSAVSDVQYLNEILRSSTFNRDKAYRVGGVRVQSFSDYVPRMVFDYLQMFADLAAKKLPAHTYTKEELFVKQFGLTGIKINMSLIPRVVNGGVAAGLDADGNYAWAKESFDYDIAIEIQNAEGYSRNCGTIAVGVSDEHIRKMMADPEIRMIIPYHKSGLNPVVAKLNNIKTYTDYTLDQNTRRASTGKKLDPKVAADKKLLDAMPDFNTILFEAGEQGNPQAAVEEYVRWCEENDLLPKFDKFCYKQIDGVFVEENGKKVIDENYYKLIEDFTVYDNGQYVPQQGITMTFPDENSAFGSMKDLIKRGLEEDAILEGDRTEKVPEIADKITEALGKKTKAPRKRMALNMAEDQDSAGFTLSEQQKKFFKNSKAVDSRGRLKLMFHGTEQFGFTVFDPKKSDDRRSLFFTDSIPVARTYTPNKEAGLRLVPTNFDPSIAEEKDFRYTPESKKEAAEYLQKLGWETEGKKLTKKEIEAASLNYARQTAREFRNWYDALEDVVDAPMFVKWLQTQSRASSVIAEAVEATRGTDATTAMWAVRKAVREMNFVKARAEEMLGWSLDEEQFEGVMAMLEALEDHQFMVRHYIGALQTEGPVVEYNAPMYGNIPMSDESIVTDASEENNRIRTGVYMVHLNLENPLIIDANFHNWDDLDYDDVYADNADGFSNETRWEGSDTRDIAEWAEEHGYDGVIFRNLIDVAGLSELDNYDEDAPSTVMIAFKPEQVKSAANKEPTSNPDIRYALDSNAPVGQEITSAKTSIKQIPALFKDKNAVFGETNIDIGGGKFDLAKNYLAERGTKSMIFDPYNRSAEENAETLAFLQSGKRADTATCANVLNVIAEPAARSNVILEVAKAIKPDGTAYFMVYEGNGTGEGKQTSSGWQNNRKTADYMAEISEWFDDVQRKGKLIIAKDPVKNLPPASWEIQPGEAIRYALSDDVKKEYSEKYDVENPSEKELMRHIERLEQEKLDAELERAAAETLRKLREEDRLAFKQQLSDQKMLDEMYYRRIGGKQLQKAEQKLDDAKARRAREVEDLKDKNLGTEMGYKREMREQKRDMKAKADARVQAERQKRLDAIALQRTIANAEKAAQHQRDEMVLGRRIAELQRKAATNLKVTTDVYRDRMSKLREKGKERTENLKQYYKLRSNAAKAVLRNKAKADAKRAEIEQEQGLVDTLRKAPAQRSFYEKKQDAISKLKSALRTAQFELENMANEIDRFAKRQVSPVTAGDLVTLLGGTTSTVEQIFKTALLDRTGNRLKVNGKELGSMKDVFLCLDSKGKVQENMQALLQDYMLHMHNQDRMSFVARAEAALTKFEEEHPYIAGLTDESLALLVTQTDKQTEELNNEPMVTAAREYAKLLEARVKAKDKAVFGDDKDNDVTAEFSKQRCEEILAQAPWVAKKAEGIYEWWDAFMRAWAVGDSLSLEQYEHMRELYPHYVPTYRKDHGGIGSPNYVGATSAKPGEATRAAKGSHEEIVNIEDTFTNMVAKIVKLARTNELYKNILDTAMLDDDGTFADMISFNWDWQTGDYGKALEEGAFFNGDLDHHIDTNVGTEVTKEHIPNSNKFKYTLYAWYNGTKFSAEISPELYRSIAAVSGQLDNEWFKAAVAAGNFLTSPMKTFITGKNPAFALRNTVRDFSTAMVNTRVVNSISGLAYPQYWARAADEMRKNSDHWNNFVALGGTHGTQYRDATTPSKALYKEKNWAGQAWDAVGKFNEATESVTRFAEYLATVDRLGDTYENRIKGIKNAAEITVDFSRKGRTGKLINAWVPYWNPAVQGISKQIRSLVESPDGSAIMKQALKIGGRVVAQQVLFEGVLRAVLKIFDRDDEWEELDDRTKDAYYCIPLKDEHKFLKIPKSREWSAILGNNIWRILESANGRADAWDNYVETSLEASYLPPAIFRIKRETGGYETDFFPLSLFNDLMTNKDFAGRTIVPTALKNGTPEMQYDADTSMLSRALGDLINFSPMQIDYIIGDYFGDFGKLFVMATAPGTWSGDRTFLQTTYDILISPWVKDNRYSNYDTGAYYGRLEELDKVVQDKKNHEGKDAAEQSLEYQVQQALESRYGNDIDALNKQARELPDGPEKDDVKQRLADLIAEAIEYHDRALAGEIDKPILDARYAKCSDRVSNELIRLDSYSETYQFKPIDSAPDKYVDPDDNEREFVFTDEQKDKYLEIYYEFYNEYVDDAMSESWYRNSDGEEQAGLVLDAKKEAATDAKEAFFDWLDKQGVRSTPRKKVHR